MHTISPFKLTEKFTKNINKQIHLFYTRENYSMSENTRRKKNELCENKVILFMINVNYINILANVEINTKQGNY